MKPLKPSMKENKRYLLIKGKNLKENIEKSILEFVGKFGLSKTGLVWIKENIISVNRESVDIARASFVIYPEKIEVLKVSGTLKGLKNN